MEAIVLAGGLGTRLRDVLPELPKVMAPVAGRPFLEFVLAALARKHFGRAVLSVGYMAEKVVDHFGKEFAGMQLTYEIETSPLGTGGATRRALKRCEADHAFVLNGDTFFDIEAAKLEALWQRRHHPIVVARQVVETQRYGRVYAENGNIVDFSPRGHDGPGMINAGCYVLPRNILDGVSPDEAFSLEADWLADAVTWQRFDLFVIEGLFIDIGTPEDYARADQLLAGVDV